MPGKETRGDWQKPDGQNHAVTEAEYQELKKASEEIRDVVQKMEIAALQSLISPGKKVTPVLDRYGFEF